MRGLKSAGKPDVIWNILQGSIDDNYLRSGDFRSDLFENRQTSIEKPRDFQIILLVVDENAVGQNGDKTFNRVINFAR